MPRIVTGKKPDEVARRRLCSQRLVGPLFETPEAMVRHFGAVQAQDYAGAKWAIGQRTQGSVDADVEDALASGKILRTHVLRPTWHFVLPADIRWLLALTAPRVRAVSGYALRLLELSETTIGRANTVIARALEGGRHLTRNELAGVLAGAGIHASGARLGYVMMCAELAAVVCSGPRRGKQFSYALLDERVPASPVLRRDEALAELGRRYFESHGPALLQDFAWWSGLTMNDAKRAVALVEPDLEQARFGDKLFWFARSRPSAGRRSPVVRLLPNYDEHLVAYRDHTSTRTGDMSRRAYVLGAHAVVSNGLVIGGWRRTLGPEHVEIDVTLLTELSSGERRALQRAAEHYARFLGLSAELTIVVERKRSARSRA